MSGILDINQANESNLKQVKGIGDVLAKRIVSYRDRVGGFTYFNELYEIPGIGFKKLQNIQNNFVIRPPENRPTPQKWISLLSISLVKVATWNLENFNLKKAEDNILNVICMSIEYNGINLLAIQELLDPKALKKICFELNNRVTGEPSRWECIASGKVGRGFSGVEYSGFLWDTTKIKAIEPKQKFKVINLRSLKIGCFVRKPYVGVFKAGDFQFAIINVHLKAQDVTFRTKKEVKKLPKLIAKAAEKLNLDENDFIVTGDFNLNPASDAFNKLKGEFINVITDNTNIGKNNLDGKKCFDHFWMSKRINDSRFTGSLAIVRSGLKYYPNTSSTREEFISNHCPVWIELFSETPPEEYITPSNPVIISTSV